MSEDFERHLRVLDLDPGATRDDVKGAYRDLSRVWHPDRFTHDPVLQEKAKRQLQEINEAYERLRAYQPAAVAGGSGLPEPGPAGLRTGPQVITPRRRVLPRDRLWLVVAAVAVAAALLLAVVSNL